MASILDKMNNSLLKEQEKKLAVKAAETGNGFSKYELCLKKDSQLTVRFDLADDEGNLSAIDENGIELVLHTDILKEDAPYYRSYIRSKFIGVELTVKVLKISPEENKIYLKSYVAGKGQFEIKGAIMAELNRAIKKHTDDSEPVTVFGRVVSLNEAGAVANVDILCRGIRGRIHKNRWQKNAHISSLENICEVGEIYQFEVHSLSKRRSNGKIYVTYNLSREHTTEDPWDNLENYQPGSVIICRVVNNPQDKHYAWGINDRFPGIEVQMSLNANFTLQPGASYKCKIRKCDKKTHKFYCSPFELVSLTGETVVIPNKVLKDTDKKE